MSLLAAAQVLGAALFVLVAGACIGLGENFTYGDFKSYTGPRTNMRQPFLANIGAHIPHM